MQLHQLTLQNYKKYTITKRKTVKNIEIMKKKAITEAPPLALPEGTEKLKPTIKLKVDDGEIAVLPFIICLF